MSEVDNSIYTLLYTERIGKQQLITASIPDIVFLTEFPFGLLFEGDNLDLSQGCLALALGFVNNLDQSPVGEESCDSISAIEIGLFQIALLSIKKKQFLKVNDHVSSLLMKDVAGLKEFLFFAGSNSDTSESLSHFQKIIGFT